MRRADLPSDLPPEKTKEESHPRLNLSGEMEKLLGLDFVFQIFVLF